MVGLILIAVAAKSSADEGLCLSIQKMFPGVTVDPLTHEVTLPNPEHRYSHQTMTLACRRDDGRMGHINTAEGSLPCDWLLVQYRIYYKYDAWWGGEVTSSLYYSDTLGKDDLPVSCPEAPT